MRRSICYCEPPHARAGQVGTWRFIHTTAQTLPKGTQIRFDLQTNGREIDWCVPSTNYKKQDTNLIYLQFEDGEILTGKEVEIPTHFIPQFEFSLPRQVQSGESFAIIVGAKDEEAEQKGAGNRCQTNSQRRRHFHMYIDPTGKKRFQDPELFTMDIHGNTLKSLRILTPSLVGKNKRFDVVVRFEDEFGNLTNKAPEETLIELSYEQLRENLNWKIFVPETGFITLPNLYFNETGVYTIQMKNLATGETWKSCPIRCSDDSDNLLLWGLLHGESDKIDSTENIDSCFRHFRDEQSLNFFSLSPFEDPEETSNEVWRGCVQAAQEFNEDERFTTFIGFQWVGNAKSEGVRQILYLKDQKQIVRKKDAKGESLEKLYQAFSPKEILSIPSFTMGKGVEFDFKQFAPDYERVVEIYNSWGSSETLSRSGNTLPIQAASKTKGVQETQDGAFLEALNKNCRFGFVAGGLDDRGIYQDFFEQKQTQYPPGLTAILAKEHTKNSLVEALHQRKTYATTGKRIVIEFYLAQEMMGQEISTADKPGLLVNRHLHGFVAGTTSIEKIELYRNGQVLETFTPETYHFNFAFDDFSPLKEVSLTSPDKELFTYYFLKVTQSDGHLAWSSPIWVDLVPKEAATKKVKK